MADNVPVAVVENTDDAGAYLETPTSYAGEGWKGIWGFFDGVRGVTDRVEGITGDIAGISQDVTDARRAPWELKRDKEAFDTEQTLKKLQVQRGDNIKLYYALGAAAVALVLILK